MLRLRGAHAALVAAITVLAFVSASCGDDEGEATGATGEETGAAGAVDVTLQEFAVIPAQGQRPPGT
jgi:hypothetical protein